MPTELLKGIIFAAVASLIASPGALFFKKASQNLAGKKVYYLLFIPNFYIGGFLYALSSLFFVYGLKFGDLSILYPISALSYIWVAIMSTYFLKEKMNNLKWFGIGIIILGVSLISVMG